MTRTFYYALSITLLLVSGLVYTLQGKAATEVIDEGVNVPVLSSDNVELVANLPEELIISASFASDKPLMYANTLNGIAVYDISDPTLPILKGELLDAHFENENGAFGEREDGTKFMIIGYDLYGVTPTYEDKSIATDNEIAIIDVTDPTNPYVASRLKTSTRTHTVTCIDKECSYAYTSGSKDAKGNGTFSILNLKDIHNPTEAKVYPSSLGTTGHDWDIDTAGIAWHTGLEGTVGYDISNPLNPKVLNSTDEHALNGSEWNAFIQHNTLRPNGERFKSRGNGNLETDVSTERTADQIRPGEVLMVTEEDYLHPGTCEDEGSFQTWHIQSLKDEKQSQVEPGTGSIEPLDSWNSKILGTDIDTQAGFICSAHYSSYHQDGFVAIGFYQQGVRILDVRDPTDIKQVGYWFVGIQEVWGADWLPARNDQGVTTGQMSNIVYSYDPTRGLDILRVTLPKQEPSKTKSLQAPISLDMIKVSADDLSEELQNKITHKH